MKKIHLIPADEVLAEELQDPEFRAWWERTAIARAVALWLTSYRAEHGLSQTELARRLGMHQPAVARLETGEDAPKLETLLKLADVLGVELRVALTPPKKRQPTPTKKRRTAPTGKPVNLLLGRVEETVTTDQGSQLVVTAR